MSNNDDEIVRACFEDIIKGIPFIADEIRKLKPMFTLEFDEEKGRYKYIFVDSLFKLFEPLFLENLKLNAELIDYRNNTEMSAFQLTTCSAEPVEKPVDKEIREIAEIAVVKSTVRVNPDVTEVLMYPVQKVHMDSWSGNELGAVMLFFSQADASKYVGWYNRTYNTLPSAPSEYTTHQSMERQFVPIELMTLVLEKRPDSVPFCYPKAGSNLTFKEA